MDVPTDRLAKIRLAIAAEIAEGAKMFGAQGVFYRLCAINNPHAVVDFVHEEGKRGTPAADVMEGLAVHLANQVMHAALQTDNPPLVCQMLMQGIAEQVHLGLAGKTTGVMVDDRGTREEVTLQGMLRGGHG